MENWKEEINYYNCDDGNDKIEDSANWNNLQYSWEYSQSNTHPTVSSYSIEIFLWFWKKLYKFYTKKMIKFGIHIHLFYLLGTVICVPGGCGRIQRMLKDFFFSILHLSVCCSVVHLYTATHGLSSILRYLFPLSLNSCFPA